MQGFCIDNPRRYAYNFFERELIFLEEIRFFQGSAGHDPGFDRLSVPGRRLWNHDE